MSDTDNPEDEVKDSDENEAQKNIALSGVPHWQARTFVGSIG